MKVDSCSLETIRRPSIKQLPGPPRTIVCIPIGGKEEEQIFEMPSCEDKDCKCEFHGKKLSRAVYNQGLVSLEWALNHMQQVVPLNTTLGYLVEKGKQSGPARNHMTKRALESGPEYLFYWDDDVILPPHTFYKMHNMMERYPDIALLTGVVCTREDPTEPMIYEKHGQGAWWNFSIDPNHPPQDIWAAGGGCLLVRTEAIRKMTEPYWADVQGSATDPTEPGGSLWGHDIYFISKLRKESGMRTCVTGSVLCGHWDVGKQKLYELPKDSPPYRASKTSVTQPAEVEECPELTEAYLQQAISQSGGALRLFLIPKKTQEKRSIKQRLGNFFDSVNVISAEDRWLAVGEGLKNGNSSVKGSAPSPSELGDVSSGSSSSSSGSEHPSISTSPERTEPDRPTAGGPAQ